MKIENNKVVSLLYEVEAEGKVLDSSSEEKPLEYIHGGNMLLPKFEENVAGMDEGEEFAFSLSPEDAYGEYFEKNVWDIPLDTFENEEMYKGLLRVGNMIPMLDPEGQVVYGKILEFDDEDVRMDFNHPLAGKTLNFKGKIIGVRDATEKELKEGLHGEYLPMEEGHCCHGHHHEDGECCHGKGHHHEDGECCHGKGHHHEDGECCHGKGHHHEDGECCHGKGHHHEDGECCHGKGHHHEDGECCHGKGHHHEDGECYHGKGHHHEDGECGCKSE